MEKEIKILQSLIEELKRGEILIGYNAEYEIKAIENLIKSYRELEYKFNKALTDLSIECKRTNEENYRCSLFAVEYNNLKEKLADSIPKSKIKEKIEELVKEAEEYGDNWGYCECRIQTLQKLMEDK